MDKKILIIKTDKAYQPEIVAYKKFLVRNGYDVDVKNQENIKKDEYSIIWRFTGSDFGIKINKNKFLIHDYKSLSTGKFKKLKDFIKKTFNKKPNLRIFLNKQIMDEYNFKDKIPSIILDMGIDKIFIERTEQKKEYDFVYCGTINYEREVDKILEWFVKLKLKEKKFLFIGDPEPSILEKYKKYKNIIFKGRIEYLEIPELLSKCIYAFNHIPKKYPYNVQTPTKFLEYSALNLRIISTQTEWIEKFLLKKKSKILLYQDLNDLTFDKIEKFQYFNINMDEYEWENIIRSSNLLSYLKKGD